MNSAFIIHNLMYYRIFHTTTYTYQQPVALDPHVIRLRSRCDGCQTLRDFSLQIEPEPTGLYQLIDLEGNSLIRVWFREPVAQLQVKVTSEVETHCTNPFNFLLEPWATKLPIDYPASLLGNLQPYFQNYGLPAVVDSGVALLAAEVHQAIAGDTVSFLTELNQRIHHTCEYNVRDTGNPLPAGLTWQQKRGSCRDLAVLFMAACRAVNLAARFVSGYQEGDPDQQERDLHAWAEVYLPGAGWRGYDPTNGVSVSDRHIALVAGALPAQAAPISGKFRGSGVESEIQYQVSIQILDSP